MNASGFASGTVPERYDSLFVPRLFEPWAELLLDRVAPKAGEALLDVACGPGTVARRAAARLASTGRVRGLDASPAMIAVARAKPPVAGAPIEYLVSPAVPLAARDGEVDVVTCQHGLQFFPDRERAVAEMRRALRPRGRVAIACWRSLDECPLFRALTDGIEEVAPGAAAQLHAAFSLGDERELERLCAGAGLHEIHVERHERPLVFEAGVAQALAGIAASPVGPQVDALPPAQKQAVMDAVARRLAPLVVGGEVRAPMAANLAIAYV